jgi:hypothetical protein
MSSDDIRSGGVGDQHQQQSGDVPEWQWLTHSSRPNGLLIGSSERTLAILRRLEEVLPGAVVHWPRDGEPWKAPLPPSTVVLHQVTALSADDQQALLAWLSDDGVRVQVIALDSRPVHPFVEQGAFLEALYYRINWVVVNASP